MSQLDGGFYLKEDKLKVDYRERIYLDDYFFLQSSNTTQDAFFLKEDGVLLSNYNS